MAEEAKKEEGAEGAEAGGKKKLPMWVIILIASQVVIVGAAVVVLKMMSKPAHEEVALEEGATEEHGESAKAEGGHGASGAEEKVSPDKIKDPKALVGPQYDLQPFVVNLVDDGRGPRYLKLEMKFELEDASVKDELDSRLNQVRDELLMLVSSKRQSDIETSDGKRILRDEIFTRVNKVLVTGRIKRVYFTDFVVQ